MESLRCVRDKLVLLICNNVTELILHMQILMELSHFQVWHNNVWTAYTNAIEQIRRDIFGKSNQNHSRSRITICGILKCCRGHAKWHTMLTTTNISLLASFNFLEQT